MGRGFVNCAKTMQRGTGATRQRQAYKRAGRWEDVVDLVVRRQRQEQREGSRGKGVCVPVNQAKEFWMPLD